ncbi:MAG: hypothetical protein N2053_11905, partial [Chitinispirillaceae bacterium]|nr:hypothetical protein [Chitinispirillaceae bacterium]
VSIPVEKMVSTLEALQIVCNKSNGGKFDCTIPLFRHDLSIEEDLIEEVGRFYGYDNIPPSETALLSLTNDNNEEEKIIDTIRYSLAFSGFNEAVTNSMTSEKKAVLLTPNIKAVKLLNPLNPEMAVMRTTLLGSLLDITAYNCNRKNFNNRFFEVGKIFEVLPSGEHSEKTVVGLIIENKVWDSTWKYSAQEVSFYILKGIIEAFSFHLGYQSCSFTKSSSLPSYFSEESAEVTIGDKIKGYAGVVKKEILNIFDIKNNVCYAELDISDILKYGLPQRSYKPIPKYPALERDFSFVMDEGIEVKRVIDEIAKISPLIESVYPFDMYRGEKIGVNKKSITFNVKFRAQDKTLTDEDVDGICKEIISIMEKKHKITLRV